jgi:hypothetical protein
MRTRCMHAHEVRAQEVCARAGGAGRRRQGSRGATHIHGPWNPRRAGGEMIMGGARTVDDEEGRDTGSLREVGDLVRRHRGRE